MVPSPFSLLRSALGGRALCSVLRQKTPPDNSRNPPQSLLHRSLAVSRGLSPVLCRRPLSRIVCRPGRTRSRDLHVATRRRSDRRHPRAPPLLLTTHPVRFLYSVSTSGSPGPLSATLPSLQGRLWIDCFWQGQTLSFSKLTASVGRLTVPRTRDLLDVTPASNSLCRGIRIDIQ